MDTILKDLLRVAGGLAALLVAPPGLAQEMVEVRVILPPGVASDGRDFRSGGADGQIWSRASIEFGAEGVGPWEASISVRCTPLSLFPVEAPLSDMPVSVSMKERKADDSGQSLVQHNFRFVSIAPGRQEIFLVINNHHLQDSRARFRALLRELKVPQETHDSDVGAIRALRRAAVNAERPRLVQQGRWAETELWLDLYDDDLPSNDVPWHCPVSVRVERLQNRCAMWAKVSGDLNGTVYGDVAYFNTFEQGVPLTTGSYADPEMHQMLQGWAGSMGDWAEWMAAQGHPLDKEDVERLKRGDDGVSEAQKELFAGQAELYQVGGDKFGLTLADTKFDAPTPTLEDGAMSGAVKEHLDLAGIAAGGGDVEGALASILGALGGALGDAQKSGQLDALGQGIGAMAGLFTLEASAPGNYPDVPHSSITLPLSSLVVAPGAIDDVGRVPFIYSKEHGVGQATLEIFPVDQNLIFGKVSGELYTEGTYSNLGRKGRIKVEAHFVALRGVNSCH